MRNNNSLLNIVFFLFFFPTLMLANPFSETGEGGVLKGVPLRYHFESADYKGGIQSWSMDQDSSGILYLANNYGLLEFDGSQWTLHKVPSCTKVRVVKVDHKNRIFVGGQGQIGYFSMTLHGLQFTSLLPLLPDTLQTVSETWRIIEHKGKVYFNTESQLFVFDNDRLKVLTLPGYIRYVSEIGQRLITQFYGMGLFELVGDSFNPVPGTSELPDIIAIKSHGNENYYFSNTGEVFRENESGFSPVELTFEPGAINDVVKMKSGDFALGTQNNGLFLLRPDLSLISHLSKNEGLSDRTIKAIYEDDFNNLWVALNNGIDYLQLSLPFSLINEEVGLEGSGYAACWYNDQIYLGTNNGLFYQKVRKENEPNAKFSLIPKSEGQVYNFSLVDGDLILDHDKGAFQIRGKHIEQFHNMGSWKFIQTPLQGVILGGDYQGMAFYKKQGDRWARWRGIDDLNESSRIMEFENDSVLWMTHGTKGAYRITFDSNMQVDSDIERYGKDNGFPSNLKISVYSLNDNLIFTSEKGIFNFDPSSNTFLPNTFFNKWLGTDHVSEIVSNGSNTIYYIQDQKLGFLRQKSFGTYEKETGLFNHINQLINDDLPDISILDDRDVIISGKEGFIKYDPQKEFSVNQDFHVILKSIVVKSSSDSSIRYNPSFLKDWEVLRNYSITFRYAAPFFDGFNYTAYAYKLIPLDKKWSDWSSLSEKEYPYIPSREYTFLVKARNVYGQESAPYSFSFEVKKPWYFSKLAIFIYVFLGFIIILFILIFQQKKFKTEKSIISRDAEETLKSKNEEINKITEKSEREIDRLLNEKLQTEIDLKNDRLTTITMHYMNKNEFIQSIRQRIDAYLNHGGDDQALKQLIKTIDSNLSNNDSWDQFAYHFDQVHGDYLKKLSASDIKLSPREIKLAAFLRMNMSSKEISNLLNITPRSVELARYRLRKKLKLERDQNLVEYLIDLDFNEIK